MHAKVFSGTVCVAISILLIASNVLADSATAPALIPKPAKLELHSDLFQLSGSTKIIANSAARETGQYLSDILARTLKLPPLTVEQVQPASNAGNIVINISPDAHTDDEGYKLDVSPDSIQITASTAAGAFYAVQTLRQLIQPDAAATTAAANADSPRWTVPCLAIEDQPRFHWRGLMLDVSRHFFTVDEVKRFLDLMALYKFNTFHWHLTDDQGWRIQIREYPKLTEVGAWRTGKNGSRYGGFYTQDQIREVVAYAAVLHITVIPEIEMPGHCQAALAAYPELSCTGGPFEVGTVWGIYKDVYCPGKEKTFDFLEHVLIEVMDLFPGSIIHIGGDEVPKDRWKLCPDCQTRIKSESLEDEAELQSYFIKRINAFVTSHDKRIIGWDEILEGGLAPGASVMSWRGTTGAVAAAQANHDVVLSPTSHCYFDYRQSKATDQPKGANGYLPLAQVYNFDPIPPDLDSTFAHHVLGAQGNLWTEHIPDVQTLDLMTFPRAAALAEVVWSPPTDGTFNDFENRLTRQLRQLDALNVNYYKPPASNNNK
jgi:hexosaminidase